MPCGQVGLALGELAGPRVDSDSVQAVVKDRKPGLDDPHAAFAEVVGGVLPSEAIKESLLVGQAQRGTVDGEQLVAEPGFERFGRGVEGFDHRRLVEFDKSGVAQLGPGLRPGSGGRRTPNGAVRQFFEEPVEVELDGFKVFCSANKIAASKGNHRLRVKSCSLARCRVKKAWSAMRARMRSTTSAATSDFSILSLPSDFNKDQRFPNYSGFPKY